MAYTLQPLIHTLEKVLHPDHHHLTFDHKKPQLETILKKATYLKEIIESSLPTSSKLIESVEDQIRITTEKAEDIIESDIVDQILSSSTVNHAAHEVEMVMKPKEPDHFISWWSFFFKDVPSPEMQQVIDELDSAIEKVTKIVDEMPGSLRSDGLNITFASAVVISGPSPVVGLDKDVMKLKEQLIGQSNKVIPIVGMGGIGKTTLAQILYNDSLITYHFDIRAWATVSQGYSLEAVLLALLGCTAVNGSDGKLGDQHDRKDTLRRRLLGKRYLIVLDDVWDTKFWDEVKRCFPDNSEGRILLTTRELSVANYASSSLENHEMHLLDEAESWSLMHMKVFGKENCPSEELEEVGKDIAKSCKGLPLAIHVVSGVLKESQKTKDFWKNIAFKISSLVTEKDEEFSKILSLSYDYLPLHLRPCFLYVGGFPEDYAIRASTVIRLWMAEGFLRSVDNKTFDEVGQEYLKALVDRNLLLVTKQTSRGKIKYFSYHDLLRDLCMRKAKQEMFIDVKRSQHTCTWTYDSDLSSNIGEDKQEMLIHVETKSKYDIVRDLHRRAKTHEFITVKRPSSTGNDEQEVFSKVKYTASDDIDLSSSMRRITIPPFESRYGSWDLKNHLPPLTRSFLFMNDDMPWLLPGLVTPRLLRLLHLTHTEFEEFPSDVLKLVNLRYLALTCSSQLPSAISRLWCLQILIVRAPLFSISQPLAIQCELWRLKEIRHLRLHSSYISAEFSNHDFILDKLETLSYIDASNFTRSDFAKKIPNVKRLGIRWGAPRYILYDLSGLIKLESLTCLDDPDTCYFIPLIIFPLSVRKLSFRYGMLLWKHMAIFGSLQNLEVLKIRYCSFWGQDTEWNPSEGGFLSLQFLLIDSLPFKRWNADETHYPNLRHLVVRWCTYLEEIPRCIGDIPTMKTIEVDDRSPGAAASAISIQKEQQDLENHDLQVHIHNFEFDLSSPLPKEWG